MLLPFLRRRCFNNAITAQQRSLSQSLKRAVEIGRMKPRLQITFTCTAPDCTKPIGHRSTHEFSRIAYEKGIVLVQCPKCHTRHLIADHLGWFDSDDLTQGGKYPNIEKLLQAKGESVTKGAVTMSGQVVSDDGQPLFDIGTPINTTIQQDEKVPNAKL